jgi:hypothetical protein
LNLHPGYNFPEYRHKMGQGSLRITVIWQQGVMRPFAN